ncbi:MAG: hypothetical protein ABIA04_08175 [Pseudomonadota bacterium]
MDITKINFNKKLGEILLEDGSITKSQLDFALEYQYYENKYERDHKIGEVLLRHDCIESLPLKIALKKQANQAKFETMEKPEDPEEIQVNDAVKIFTYKDKEMKKIVSTDLMIKHMFVPMLFKEDDFQRNLYIATIDPEDRGKLEELSFYTSCFITAFKSSPKKILKYLRKYFLKSYV